MSNLFPSRPALLEALVPKSVFLKGLKNALENRQGYAASKLGATEKHLLAYRMLLDKNVPHAQLRLLELWLKRNAVSYAGLFPGTPQFYNEYSREFLASTRTLDMIGICSPEDTGIELDIVNYFEFANPLTDYKTFNSDTSIPEVPTNCYLPFLRGKRILIVNPFANLLAARATREIFEGVWQVSGKKFFEPADVQGLEFPYGFARETWERYASAMELQREIQAEMERREFDVALIGAGGMGIPLAAHVKQMGKVALALGGYLQIIFGVKGNRWKLRPKWRDVFFNEWWIDMPEEYRPKPGDDTGDYSYW